VSRSWRGNHEFLAKHAKIAKEDEEFYSVRDLILNFATLAYFARDFMSTYRYAHRVDSRVSTRSE
jgi:hypothetical protein